MSFLEHCATFLFGGIFVLVVYNFLKKKGKHVQNMGLSSNFMIASTQRGLIVPFEVPISPEKTLDTGVFIAPDDGVYSISAMVKYRFDEKRVDPRPFTLRLNGDCVAFVEFEINIGDSSIISFTFNHEMKKGESIWLEIIPEYAPVGFCIVAGSYLSVVQV